MGPPWEKEGTRCRVYVLSDVHTDHRENWKWIQELSNTEYKNDCLIVAGDLCDDLKLLEETLRTFCSKFGKVFFTPGNHELWLNAKDRTLKDSVEKFHAVLLICDDVGVETTPTKVGSLWIFPMFSWYEACFDEDPTPDANVDRIWSDFRNCKWPHKLPQSHLASYFTEMNKAWIPHVVADKEKSGVISFSHFLPRRELLPPKECLHFNLFKVAGSLLIEEQIRELGSVVHCFGHSHIATDVTIEGIRYIQNPVGYPEERCCMRQIPAPHLPKLIW
eukprot:CAMPEP_0184671468 /NCGR_PEP_ID=MMETSP0308-20130426/85520_1 /TAXON_ID=38269 /ORGANISM="Gloeochaete witrockiana, Strain SAG 46.84" /LENGTH=275 /DNA_ID=CAMNT_0027118607 /DNA_START=161 /DNA_END=985 /DNA_ORIENTATION=+